MRIIKISLALAVLGIISYFVINSLGGAPEKDKVAPPENTFINQIENEIKILSELPDNKFCKVKYNEVKYYIDDHYRNQRLGKDNFQNDQWKEILSKKLYFTYTDKFIKQAYAVFNKTEWKIQDIAFIRSECKIMRESKFLEKKSLLDNSFVKIQQILSKYDEINNFVKPGNGFIYNETSLKSRFPFSDLKNEISQIDIYKKNKLENDYVNNCKRLHDDLDSLKKKLINSYLIYLENKISQWIGKYSQYDFNTFNEYQSIIFNPLKEELEEFENNCEYNNYSYDYNRYTALSSKLNADRTDAYKYIK